MKYVVGVGIRRFQMHSGIRQELAFWNDKLEQTGLEQR